MKLKHLFFALFLIPTGLLGQSVLSYVPADITFLMTWNPQNINEKVDLKQFQQMEFYNMMLQEMTTGMDSLEREDFYIFMTEPALHGLGAQTASHVAVKLDGGDTYFSYLVPLVNRAAFESYVQRMVDRNQNPEDRSDMGAYTYYQMEKDMAMAWNDQVLIISTADIQPEEPLWYEEYPYPDYGTDTIYEEPIVVEEIVEEAPETEDPATVAIIEWVARSFGQPADASILTNREFKKSGYDEADFHIWMDYGAFMKSTTDQMQGQLGMLSSMASMSGMAAYYQGVALSVGFEFNDGEVEGEVLFFDPEKNMKAMKKAYRTCFNKDLLRYLPDDGLLAMYSLQYDLERLMEAMGDLYRPMLADMPMVGAYSESALDVLGILVDEKAVYNILEGDVVVALTGLNEVVDSIPTFEYDIDFNPIPSMRTQVRQMPEMTMLFSVGNEENLRKILALAENLGMVFNQGGFYEVFLGQGPAYQLGIARDVMVVTNNPRLISEHLQTGLPKADRIAGEEKKMLRKNIQTIYWDAEETLKLFDPEKGEMSQEEKEIVQSLQGQLEEIEMESRKGSGKVLTRSQFEIELINSEVNSLEQFLQIFNNLMLEAMGGARI